MGNTRQQIQWAVGDGAISEVGTDDPVFYIDDIKPDIIVAICKAWNEGLTVKEIGKMLDKMDDISMEETEYVEDQLTKYEKLMSTTPEKVETEGTIIASNISIGQEALVPKAPTQDELIKAAEKIVETPKELSRGEKAAATRKANNSKPSGVVGGGKKGSAATLIADMQAQQEKLKRVVECIEWIDGSLFTDNIPQDLSKSERDTILAYIKAVEIVQSEYLLKIQSV